MVINKPFGFAKKTKSHHNSKEMSDYQFDVLFRNVGIVGGPLPELGFQII